VFDRVSELCVHDAFEASADFIIVFTFRLVLAGNKLCRPPGAEARVTWIYQSQPEGRKNTRHISRTKLEGYPKATAPQGSHVCWSKQQLY
jgi:hypothetical protein